MSKFLHLVAISAMLGLSTNLSATTPPVTLTFNRTGTTATSVAVTATGLDGVTAEFTSSNYAFKTGGVITSEIVCPNINANTSPTITMVMTVRGLPSGYKCSNIALDIHALNGASNYQEHSDGAVRQWNVNLSFNNQEFSSLNNIDIAAGVNPEGTRHKVWDVSVTNPVETSDPLVLTINVTRGTTNGGCFFGLSSITLSNPLSDASAEELFNIYTAYRKKRLQMLDLWNGGETSATGIVLNTETSDLETELETKKAQFDAAEEALYAQLDNRNFVFRKNHLSKNESHPISFISSNSTGLYATATPDATSIWRAHRIEGRTFKFENEATGRWFGTTDGWEQNVQIPTTQTENDASEYQLDYIPAGTQATEQQLKGAIVLVNTHLANADSDADKCALHHGNADPNDIVCWFANANTASYRKSSWHATVLSDEAARAMAAGFLTGDALGQYSVSGEPLQLATLTHDNAAEELARYESESAVFTLNLPQTDKYVTVNGTKYFFTPAGTLCNYESGRYLTANGNSLADAQGELGSDNAAEVTFAEGKIAHYNITSGNSTITDAVLDKTDALSVSAPEFISFIAPVAVSFNSPTNEIYVATKSEEKLTIEAATPETIYAAGTGFIVRSEGQSVEFTIAESDQEAVNEFAGTFSGTHEAYIFQKLDNGMIYYAIMPAQANEIAPLDESNTVCFTRQRRYCVWENWAPMMSCSLGFCCLWYCFKN